MDARRSWCGSHVAQDDQRGSISLQLSLHIVLPILVILVAVWVACTSRKTEPVETLVENGTLPKSPAQVYSIVDERSADLSYEEFVFEYLLPRRAVIIKGLAKRMLPHDWGWRALYEKCGDNMGVKLAFHKPKETARTGNKFFADLIIGREVVLGDYMKQIENGLARKPFSAAYRQGALVFDNGLVNDKILQCGLENLTLPRYVTNDVLKRTNLDGEAHDPFYAQPSLFLGMNHVRWGPLGGGLHRDAFASHFWQALAEGRKEWIVICGLDPPYREQALYAHNRTVLKESGHIQEMDPQSYLLDAFSPNFTLFPLAQQALRTNAARFTVEAGDFVFIPASCPHQVRTLSPKSVAISQNFVDATNVDDFLRNIAIDGSSSTASALALALEGKIPPLLRDPPELRYREHTTYGESRPWEQAADFF